MKEKTTTRRRNITKTQPSRIVPLPMLMARMIMPRARNIPLRPSSILKMPGLNHKPRTRRASNRSKYFFREVGASCRLPAFVDFQLAVVVD